MGIDFQITSKEKARDRANIRMGESFQNFIKYVEGKIATTYVEGHRVLIYPNDVAGYKHLPYEEQAAIRSTVLSMYRSQGWEAKYENSQRDGPWIELK